jgi:flagellar biosynthesis protein FlhF
MSGPRPTQGDGSPLVGEKLKEHYLNQSIRFLFRQMSVTPQANFTNQKVVALVGSTGVGKTTSIAKLAARLQLNDKKRVALVSMDAFRIAAADQLRAYSKILDCPFTEVSDLEDLSEFVAKFYDYDVIFIDTAGRSSKHNSQMDQLKQLTTMPFPVHFHMVQSASMKQRDLDENLKAFRMVNPQSLIFTKLDESWSFGEILNTNITSKIPLSFFTTGQKVPEDLEPATKERVVERIFRL